MSNISKTRINASQSVGLTAQTETRTKILSEASDDFRDMYSKIRETLLTEEQNVIRSRYAIGEMVYDMDMDESRYGSNAVQRMEEAIGFDRCVIYNSLSFVRKYSKEAVEALLELRTKSGQPLLWTHVTHLLRVQEVDLREELTQTILDNDLSPTDLLSMIQKLHGKGPGRTSNAGKPMARPKSVRGYIDQQWALVEQLLRRKEKVWAGAEKQGDKSFFDVLDDTPLEKIDDSTLTDMEQLQKLFEKASYELDEYATKLLEARKRVERDKRRGSNESKSKKSIVETPDDEEEPDDIEEETPGGQIDDDDDDIDDDDNEEIDDNDRPITNPSRLPSRNQPGTRFARR